MPAIDHLLELFARSIFAKVRAMGAAELTRRQRNRLLLSIDHDIRTCGGLIFPDAQMPEVSRAAQQEAERMGVDLCTKSWHNQMKFDCGRKTFHWEHVIPVSLTRHKCKEAHSEDEVLALLKTHLRIAWILKREDSELTRLGYRTKRLHPDEAYRHAGIELIRRNQSLTSATPTPAGREPSW